MKLSRTSLVAGLATVGMAAAALPLAGCKADAAPPAATVELRRTELAAAAGRIAASLEQQQSEQPRP